jgi:N-acyl-D-aspartate/D-glutamate deacylase
MAYDLLIKDARVVDGTGTGSYIGDVGVRGDAIALVGKADAGAARVIEAEGRAVAPGFIDGHTHYDAQIFWDPLLTSTSWHGFTTVVMGHCGLTLSPVRARDRAYMAQALSRVEEIPLDVIDDNVEWGWETFADYVAAVRRRPLGLNVVPQAGHSAIRRWVMGDDYQREATPDEIDQMRERLRESLRAGANGFTSSHGKHIDMNDIPIASVFAAREEIHTLVSVLGEENAGVFQMATRTLSQGLAEDERAFLADLSRTTGRPVTINGLDHTKRSASDWLGWLERSARSGARMRSNAMVMPGEMRFRLDTSGLINQRNPFLSKLSQMPRAEAVALLRSPEGRAEALAVLAGLQGLVILGRIDWERCRIGETGRAENRHVSGRLVGALAREAGVSAPEYVLDLALADDLATELTFTSEDEGPEDAARAVAESPYTLLGTSDGGAHLATTATTHVSTSFLGHWVREKGRTSLEQAVRKLTFIPAATYGLDRRGLIQEGYYADLVLFDPETIAPGPALVTGDLPNGRPRMVRHATGISHLIVNGQVVLEGETPTGAHPGRLLLNRLAAG